MKQIIIDLNKYKEKKRTQEVMKSVPIFSKIITENGIIYGIVEGTDEKVRIFDPKEV